MRVSQSLLLASVAILSLPSCSSAQGPGEIGTTDDIVVRNHGDAPLPPSATALAAPAATTPDMMASKTTAPVEGGTEVSATSQTTQAAADTGGMEAVPAPAVEAPVPATPEAAAAAMAPDAQVTPVGAPLEAGAQAQVSTPAQTQADAMVAAPMAEPALQDSSLATRPATTAAGNAPVLSPEVAAGGEVRTAPQADRPGEVIGEVNAAPVEQAAEEFQNQPVEQAAEKALENPPTPVATTPVPRAPAAPRGTAVTQNADMAAGASAAPATAYPARTSLRPSAEDIANGGMRVVRTDDGQVTEKAFEGAAQAPSAPAMAPAPSAPVTQTAPAPVAEPVSTPAPAPASTAQNGAPVLDKDMIRKAQGVLSEKGFYNGPADGEMSTATLNALSRYQAANFLTPGAMTVETAQHMGLIQ